MSLIESLREQVSLKEAAHAAHLAELEAQQRVYEETLRPTMLKMLGYFSELVDSLRLLDTKTSVHLPLAPDKSSTVSMEQSGYRFSYDDGKNPTRLEVFCECVLTAPQRFYVSNPQAVENYTQYLDDMQLAYHKKTQLDGHYDVRSAVFELEGALKIGIRIDANPESGRISFYLLNLETMSTRKYEFSPEKIDESFLERLAKLLLRQESKLVSIKLCPDIRAGLRAKVQSDRIKREAELKIAFEELRIARLQELEDRKISARLRYATRRVRAKLLGVPA